MKEVFPQSSDDVRTDESNTTRRGFFGDIKNFAVSAFAASILAAQASQAAEPEAEVPDEEPAVAEVPAWGNIVLEKNGCTVMARKEKEFTRFRVFDAKGGLIHEAVTESNQFKGSPKKGVIGEFTLRQQESDLDHRQVIHEDGTLITDIMRSNEDGKGNVIRQVVEPGGDERTITPYDTGKPTDLRVRQKFDPAKETMKFDLLSKDGDVLFTRDMSIPKSHRRKPDGLPAPKAGRIGSVTVPNAYGKDDLTLDIRGKDGYLIYYGDYKLGSRSSKELYIEQDDGPIAYVFFHPNDPDLPHIVIMRNGDIRELKYDKDGKVTGWEKVPKPVENTKE